MRPIVVVARSHSYFSAQAIAHLGSISKGRSLRFILLGLTVALLALVQCPIAMGSIISYDVAPADGGILTCDATWNSDSYMLAVTGVQRQVDGQGYVGQLLGTFTTDTDTDPTVVITNSIANDTDFTWTGYHINIFMRKIFTISDASVTSPADWEPAAVAQPQWDGSRYVGAIDFHSATGVPVGQSLQFGYTLAFDGSIEYCQEMIPTPEPATMALLGIGSLALIRRRSA